MRKNQAHLKTRHHISTALTATALTVSATLLAACGTSPAGAPTGTNTTTGHPLTGAKIALITHSAPGDTFWDDVRAGAEDAAVAHNMKLLYSANPEGGKQAQLVEQAIEQKVAGIVVSLAKPDALANALQTAKKTGIPVFTINSGENRSAALGALAHFGQNERTAGEGAGQKLKQLGAKHVLCVIHEQGNIGHDERCQGAETTLNGTLERVYVNGADMPSVLSTLTAKLQANPQTDHILTLAAPIGLTAIQAVESAGGKTKIATFDVNPEAQKALETGKLEFLVDQQPYLQGYEAVDAVWLNADGHILGGGKPILTGPKIVTRETNTNKTGSTTEPAK